MRALQRLRLPAVARSVNRRFVEANPCPVAGHIDVEDMMFDRMVRRGGEGAGAGPQGLASDMDGPIGGMRTKSLSRSATKPSASPCSSATRQRSSKAVIAASSLRRVGAAAANAVSNARIAISLPPSPSCSVRCQLAYSAKPHLSSLPSQGKRSRQ